MDFEFGSLKFRIPDGVYRPSDDSIMLARHATSLKGKILDMGTGCGMAAIANAASNPGNGVLGVDINPEAVACAKDNAERNGIKNVKFVESNMFSAVSGRKFDCIIFNPPYLPTDTEEKLQGKINAAFDGGKDGRETLDRFLSEFEGHLTEKGTLLLIHSSLNGPEKTKKILEEKKFKVEILEKHGFFFEKLFLCRASHY